MKNLGKINQLVDAIKDWLILALIVIGVMLLTLFAFARELAYIKYLFWGVL